MRYLYYFTIGIIYSILICMLPLCASEARRSGDFVYKIDKKGVILTRYTGTDTVLTVPRKFSGVSVTVIGSDSVTDCGTLEEVLLPSSVVIIKQNAFSSCSSLRRITIPSSVSRIEEGALPDSVTIVTEKDCFAYRFGVENGFSICIDSME